jgi:hypothetical protein
MEVSGQLHAPAALTPVKEPLVPIGWEAGWDPEPVWTSGEAKRDETQLPKAVRMRLEDDLDKAEK